jgi:hypothetical protein
VGAVDPGAPEKAADVAPFADDDDGGDDDDDDDDDEGGGGVDMLSLGTAKSSTVDGGRPSTMPSAWSWACKVEAPSRPLAQPAAMWRAATVATRRRSGSSTPRRSSANPTERRIKKGVLTVLTGSSSPTAARLP